MSIPEGYILKRVFTTDEYVCYSLSNSAYNLFSIYEGANKVIIRDLFLDRTYPMFLTLQDAVMYAATLHRMGIIDEYFNR